MRAPTARYPYIPVVSYRVAPREEQRAGAAGNRGLIWNISGSVPSAAAIAVGLLAFSSSSDLPASDRSADLSAPASTDRLTNAWLTSVPRLAATDPEPDTERDAGAGTQGTEPAVAVPLARPESRMQFAAVAESLPRQFRPAPGPVLELAAEAIVPPPSIAPGPDPVIHNVSATGTEIVRRDYSKTLGIVASVPPDDGARKNAAIDLPTGRVAAIRDRLGSLRSRTGSGDVAATGEALQQSTGAAFASNGQAMVHGPVSDGEVTLSDGELAAVKLGALLNLVEGKMERTQYEALAQSSNAQAFVTPTQIEDMGMQASFDAETKEIALTSIR